MTISETENIIALFKSMLKILDYEDKTNEIYVDDDLSNVSISDDKRTYIFELKVFKEYKDSKNKAIELESIDSKFGTTRCLLEDIDNFDKSDYFNLSTDMNNPMFLSYEVLKNIIQNYKFMNIKGYKLLLTLTSMENY